jgi:hypothetical protein
VALAVAMFLAPFASGHPDGLEFVLGEKLGLLKAEPPPALPVPIPDYELKVLGPDALGVATAAAGVVGTLVVFAVAALLAGVVARAGRGGQDPAPAAPVAAGTSAGGVSPDAA